MVLDNFCKKNVNRNCRSGKRIVFILDSVGVFEFDMFASASDVGLRLDRRLFFTVFVVAQKKKQIIIPG